MNIQTNINICSSYPPVATNGVVCRFQVSQPRLKSLDEHFDVISDTSWTVTALFFVLFCFWGFFSNQPIISRLHIDADMKVVGSTHSLIPHLPDGTIMTYVTKLC